MRRHRSTAVTLTSIGILMLDEILRRINYFLLGALLMIIGAAGSFVGVAFLGITLFGDAQFETVTFLIGAFSLTTGPPATLAGVRLLLNKPNENGGLLSPRMIRVFAVFFAILGIFSVWEAHEVSLTISIFAGLFFTIVTQQAFALAHRRETAHKSDELGSAQTGKHTARLMPTSVPSKRLHQGRTRTGVPPFEFVYVTEDGTVREVSPRERNYLSEEFEAFDGARPYIKNSLQSLDGWGGKSGFLERSKVPLGIRIEPINPDYDDRYEALMESRSQDAFSDHREVGDIVETDPDGSVVITFDPEISNEARFEKFRKLKKQQRREEDALAKYADGFEDR